MPMARRKTPLPLGLASPEGSNTQRVACTQITNGFPPPPPCRNVRSVRSDIVARRGMLRGPPWRQLASLGCRMRRGSLV